MVFENPLAELVLPAVERQIPVGGLAHRHGGVGQGRTRVDEVGGVERRATGLALVAVGVLVAAARTGAGHIAVGEKFAGRLVVGLERGLDGELPLVEQTGEELRGSGAVDVGGCARIDVERYSEIGQRLLDDGVITVDDVLRCHPFAAGAQGDGHAMFVAAADHQHVASLKPEIAGIDVGRDVDAGKMAYMDRPVGVREGRCYESALEVLFHYA